MLISASIAAASLFSAAQTDGAIADLGPEGVAQLARCGVDEGDLQALLELDQDAFDQDPDGDGGRWPMMKPAGARSLN